MIAGIFIGTMLGGIRLFSLEFIFSQNISDTLKFILICSGILMVFILVIAGILAKNSYKGKFLGFAIFLSIVLLYFSILIITANSKKSDYEKLNIDELNLLADNYEKNGNYERCIWFLEVMDSKIKKNDPRSGLIKQKLESVKTKQLEKTP